MKFWIFLVLQLANLPSSVFLPVLSIAVRAKLIYYVLHRIITGVFTLTLIAYTLYWYRIEEAALRFLFWKLITPKFFQLLATYGTLFILLAGYAVNLVLFYYIQISGMSNDVVGWPMEVQWLSAEQKVMYSRMAAAHRLFANTGGALWRQQRVGHSSTAPR